MENARAEWRSTLIKSCVGCLCSTNKLRNQHELHSQRKRRGTYRPHMWYGTRGQRGAKETTLGWGMPFFDCSGESWLMASLYRLNNVAQEHGTDVDVVCGEILPKTVNMVIR